MEWICFQILQEEAKSNYVLTCVTVNGFGLMYTIVACLLTYVYANAWFRFMYIKMHILFIHSDALSSAERYAGLGMYI